MKRERIILGSAAALSLVSTLYYRLPIVSGLLFLLVEVGGTFCVGRLIVKALQIDKRSRCAADTIALSLAFGYGASILFYVAAFFMLPPVAIRVAFLAVSALALIGCIALFCSGDVLIENDDSRSQTVGLFAIILVIFTFTYMLPNYLPIDEANSYYLDNLFWVGNNVELEHAIPPDSFRNVLLPNLRYHYLSSLRMALVQISIGAPAFEACFAYSFFDIAALLSSCAVMFVHEYLDERYHGDEAFKWALALLVFSTGLERLAAVSLLSHLYIASFGFAESFSFLLLLLVFAKRLWDGAEIHRADAIAVTAITALCMGCKGALGFVGMLFSGTVCTGCMPNSKRRRDAIIFGLCVLIAGLVIYCLLLSGGVESNTGDVENVRRITGISVFRPFYTWLRGLPIPRIFAEIIFAALYFFSSHPLLWALVAYSLVRVLQNRNFDVLDAACGVSVLVCFVIMRFVHMRGFSQSYFLMAAFPIAWAFVFRRAEIPRQCADRDIMTRRWRGVAVAASLLLFCHQFWIARLTYKSVAHLAGQESGASMFQVAGFNDNIVSPEEYSVLVWVRDNLPYNSLYACDAYDGMATTLYYPGVISGRHILRSWDIAGVSWQDEYGSVFKGDAVALSNCRNLGIEYYIQIKDGATLDVLFPGQFVSVYSDGDMAVWALV